MGVKAIESHLKSEKHQRNAAVTSGAMLIPASFARSTPKTLSDSLATSQQSALSNFVSPPETQRAEVLWILHTVSRHHSFRLNDDIRSVFAALFPDWEYAKSFTCSENKTAYVAKYSIASFIKRELLRRVSAKSYVVMFNKSMNTTTKSKQMDLHLRYWITDEMGTHVISRYYGSQFVGHSRVEDMDHFKVSLPAPFPSPSPFPKKLSNPRLSSYDTIGESRIDPIILAKLHFFKKFSAIFCKPDRCPDYFLPRQRFGEFH